MKEFFSKIITQLLQLINTMSNRSINKTLNKIKMAETQEFNSGFGKAGCHIENVGELLVQFDTQFVTEDGTVVKLDGEQVLKLMGTLYNKLKETLAECEGKDVVIEFGDSPTANLMEQVVKFILGLAERN